MKTRTFRSCLRRGKYLPFLVLPFLGKERFISLSFSIQRPESANDDTKFHEDFPLAILRRFSWPTLIITRRVGLMRRNRTHLGADNNVCGDGNVVCA